MRVVAVEEVVGEQWSRGVPPTMHHGRLCVTRAPPSGPGVACHSALPLGALCTPKMLLKRFGQRENSSSKESSSH